MCSLVGVHLAHPDSRGPIGFLRDTFDWSTRLPEELSEGLRTAVGSGKQYMDNMLTGLFPDDKEGVRNENKPASPIGPSMVAGNLSGTATGPSGTATAVTGTINTSGNFNVSGRNVTISGSYTNGAVTGGTFQHGTSSGTIAPPGTNPPPANPQPPGSSGFPLDTPYLLCNYSHLRSSSSRYGYTYEFVRMVHRQRKPNGDGKNHQQLHRKGGDEHVCSEL